MSQYRYPDCSYRGTHTPVPRAALRLMTSTRRSAALEDPCAGTGSLSQNRPEPSGCLALVAASSGRARGVPSRRRPFGDEAVQDSAKNREMRVSSMRSHRHHLPSPIPQCFLVDRCDKSSYEIRRFCIAAFSWPPPPLVRFQDHPPPRGGHLLLTLTLAARRRRSSPALRCISPTSRYVDSAPIVPIPSDRPHPGSTRSAARSAPAGLGSYRPSSAETALPLERSTIQYRARRRSLTLRTSPPVAWVTRRRPPDHDVAGPSRISAEAIRVLRRQEK